MARHRPRRQSRALEDRGARRPARRDDGRGGRAAAAGRERLGLFFHERRSRRRSRGPRATPKGDPSKPLGSGGSTSVFDFVFGTNPSDAARGADAAASSSYTGHYIVLCGYDDRRGAFHRAHPAGGAEEAARVDAAALEERAQEFRHGRGSAFVRHEKARQGRRPESRRRRVSAGGVIITLGGQREGWPGRGGHTRVGGGGGGARTRPCAEGRRRGSRSGSSARSAESAALASPRYSKTPVSKTPILIVRPESFLYGERRTRIAPFSASLVVSLASASSSPPTASGTSGTCSCCSP